MERYGKHHHHHHRHHKSEKHRFNKNTHLKTLKKKKSHHSPLNHKKFEPSEDEEL